MNVIFFKERGYDLTLEVINYGKYLFVVAKQMSSTLHAWHSNVTITPQNGCYLLFVINICYILLPVNLAR